ncbi:MAG TPA: diguanylate cyclase [Solirubrobacteraceae bacterium]|nr:diguanylate cyclase [Solirubrobacteraceae bacterium]
MEHRLKPVRATAMGLMALALLLSGPWLGWWPLGMMAIAAVGFALADRQLPRYQRPELAIASAWVLAQVLIAVAVALTGGAASPAVAWLAIPVVTLSARFDVRGVVAGVLFTALLMIGAIVAVDPAIMAEAPHRVIAPITLLVAVACLSTALMRSDIAHREESVIDGLTGMLNRRALTTRVAELAAQAQVTGEPIGVVIGDLDRFKSINDEHGHAAGDAVLVDVAYNLRKELRAFDLAYRLGGEEFLILLPGATLAEAAGVAERLREAIGSRPSGGLPITMSFGVASSGGGGFDYDAVLAAADAALYEAKAAGRNRVSVAGVVPGVAVAA